MIKNNQFVYVIYDNDNKVYSIAATEDIAHSIVSFDISIGVPNLDKAKVKAIWLYVKTPSDVAEWKDQNN